MLAWGDNTHGQCGLPVMSSGNGGLAVDKPWRVEDCEDIKEVACGWRHTIILAKSGQIRVLGNTSNQGGGPVDHVQIGTRVRIGTRIGFECPMYCFFRRRESGEIFRCRSRMLSLY